MSFEELLRLVPESCRSQSGAVFNSGRRAFSSASPLYVLGLNPGGDPAKHAAQTVAWNIEKVAARPEDWCEFCDESWDQKLPGTHALQRRILHVLRNCGLDSRRVPASNVVFKRTSDAAGVKGELDVLAGRCWPFHEKVIEGLGVSTVLCLGKDAGGWVRKRLRAHAAIDRFSEANRRGWDTEAHTNERGIVVISATHPSRVDWTNPASDPSPFVRRMLNRKGGG